MDHPLQKASSVTVPRHSPIQSRLGAQDATLEFGRFRMLVRRRQLTADGIPVRVGTRAFDLLTVLLEADGSLVAKEELLSRLWPGIYVSEENLKVQISALRKAQAGMTFEAAGKDQVAPRQRRIERLLSSRRATRPPNGRCLTGFDPRKTFYGSATDPNSGHSELIAADQLAPKGDIALESTSGPSGDYRLALHPSYSSVSRSAFAAFRSAVSKPSVKRS
jgi:hypothetical protein